MLCAKFIEGIDMTQEERQLLIQDLCARLPYGVKFQGEDSNVYTLDAANYFALQVEGVVFKPYLRPMSSMTQEERREYCNECNKVLLMRYRAENHYPVTDWLLSHHFDMRGLIGKGLAIDCTDLNIY